MIQNVEWQRGIGTSISRGVEQLRSEVDVIVILTCDQPFVSAEAIRQLMSQDQPIVASGYSETVGIPALFDSRYFDALGALADDRGAKSIIVEHRIDTAVVDLPEAAIDIDTRDDYQTLKSR